MAAKTSIVDENEAPKQNKKRSREVSQQQTPFKKQKKSTNANEGTGIAPTNDSVEGVKEKKKHKKSKKTQEIDDEENEQSQDPAPETHTQSSKKKKHKQSKNVQDNGDAEAAAEQQDELPEQERTMQLDGSALETISKPPAGTSQPLKQIFSEESLAEHTPFVKETWSLYVQMAPISNAYALQGVCAEHLSPHLLTYYQPFDGIMLSYENPRLSEHPDVGAKLQNGQTKKALAKSIDEYGVTYIWMTAEFTLFRPCAGTILEGHVNLQNPSMLGLLCYNYFNASVDSDLLPKDWRWHEDGEFNRQSYGRGQPVSNGYYVDGQGQMVEGRVLFKVNDFRATSGGFGISSGMNISGTLLANVEKSI